MPKQTKDKTRINSNFDTYLNDILNNKKLNKSGLINSLLYKYLTLEQNKTLNAEPQTPNSSKCRFRDLNTGPPDYESGTLTN